MNLVIPPTTQNPFQLLIAHSLRPMFLAQHPHLCVLRPGNISTLSCTVLHLLYQIYLRASPQEPSEVHHHVSQSVMSGSLYTYMLIHELVHNLFPLPLPCEDMGHIRLVYPCIVWYPAHSSCSVSLPNPQMNESTYWQAHRQLCTQNPTQLRCRPCQGFFCSQQGQIPTPRLGSASFSLAPLPSAPAPFFSKAAQRRSSTTLSLEPSTRTSSSRTQKRPLMSSVPPPAGKRTWWDIRIH